MYTSGSNFLFHLLSLRYRTYMNDRTMDAVKQKLTNVNAEIPVVEGKNKEYVCFLAYATIASSGMEASEGIKLCSRLASIRAKAEKRHRDIVRVRAIG